MTDRCIVCGAEIPEGRQICLICEIEGVKRGKAMKSAAGAQQEGDLADKYIPKYTPKTENAIQNVFAASARAAPKQEFVASPRTEPYARTGEECSAPTRTRKDGYEQQGTAENRRTTARK